MIYIYIYIKSKIIIYKEDFYPNFIFFSFTLNYYFKN